MSLERVGYDSPRCRLRLTACPYCGEEFAANAGQEIVSHLPCDETPTTAEVFAALEARDSRSEPEHVEVDVETEAAL